jgi:zinc protease
LSELIQKRGYMKKVLLLAVLVSTMALGQRVQLPPSTRHTLDNGLTVILMEYRKVPVVHFRLVVRGGSAKDPEGMEGLASITTSLMREGTTTRSSTELAQAIDFTGGSLSVSAGLEYCAVKAEVLTKDLDTGLNLFADVIVHPTFPEEEIERERKQRMASLDGLKEDPQAVASVVFSKTVYASHPYGKQAAGTRASLELFTRAHVVDFYQQTFVPNGSILAVVGDFSSPEMLTRIRETFSSWKQGDQHENPLAQPLKLQGRRVVLVDKPDLTQTQIVIGNIGINIKHPDFFAVKVANVLFGGGFTSRLVDALRVKRSLTYGASSGFATNLFGGTYAISTFTKNSTIVEAIDVVLNELTRFQEKGASMEECKKAQNYIAGSFARSLQAPEALAARITDIEFYGFPRDYVETYIQKVKAVTLADVERVAQKYFLVDDLLFVLVSPAETTRSVVEKYGPVSVVPLKDAIQ